MANTLVQFRADETERSQAVQILGKLGLDLPSYLRMSLSRLVSENGIPFSMKLESPHSDQHPSANRGISAMQRASQIAKEQGISNMSLDDINSEIAAARK